jgi:uncharacterized protein (TIGR04222 family)
MRPAKHAIRPVERAIRPTNPAIAKRRSFETVRLNFLLQLERRFSAIVLANTGGFSNMDFLIDNPLTNLNGPAFLVLFGIFSILVLVSQGLAKSMLDRTDQLPIPAIPPEIDPYEVAYLRGGPNELARSVIFSLVQKELIEFRQDEKTAGIKRRDFSAPTGHLLPIESVAYNWIGASREAKHVFDTTIGLVKQFEQFSHKYDIDLSNRQFLMPEDLKTRAKRYSYIAAGLIAGLGVYKVAAAILLGSFNIIFALIITVIGFFIAMTMGKMPNVTKLGKQYLDRLNLAFSDLKYRSQAPYIGDNPRPAIAEGGFAGVDPLLLSVGIFGTGILAGTAFASYNDTFAKAQQQQQAGWGGGGCGSSCGSSCSSGDGGGGSSCGGGCGGCS